MDLNRDNSDILDCHRSIYRKKRFFGERKENTCNNNLEDLNYQLSILNLNKKQKISKDVYIYNYFNISNLEYGKTVAMKENNFEISNMINMDLEKKLIETHYSKVNKNLSKIMFNNDK